MMRPVMRSRSGQTSFDFGSPQPARPEAEPSPAAAIVAPAAAPARDLSAPAAALVPAAAPSAASEASLPAARTLARVLALRSGRLVQLPAPFARAAMLRFLECYRVQPPLCDVVEGPTAPADGQPALRDDQWAMRLPASVLSLEPPFGVAPRRDARGRFFVFPKHSVVLPAADARRLLRSLEAVKPEELDAEGRPLPWVPATPRTESLRSGPDDEQDIVLVGESEPLGPPPEPDAAAAWADARTWFDRLARLAGFEPPPLTIARGRGDKHGLVTGRVWYARDYRPRRVHVTVCPNADLAEVLATLVHELAHPLSRTHAHGDEFKRALVELAGRAWGGAFFAEARLRLDRRSTVVDCWLASGIRAALRGAPPPEARSGDDGQLARVVTRIRKLRELAADQLGLPEAVAATGAANDLVTTWGLESYALQIDAGIDEQMVDRWVVLDEDAVWQRRLAHDVARYCEVFSLSLTGKGRMHFFGRHADVVAAEYLYSVCAGRISRECERHLAEWRRARGRVAHGEAVRERTSFCDSAVDEFGARLAKLAAEENAASGRRRKSDALAGAEQFAREEHEKRGSSWGTGSGKTFRDNAAGRETGRALEVVRGISAAGGAQKQLPSRR